MAKRPPLHVWLYGTRVAELTSTRPGEVVCTYTDEARDRWPLNTALLSCSLPLDGRRHRMAGTFFRGLLPEGAALAALAARARVPTFDTFGMLARFGRDVAGAAVISANADDTHVGWVEPYDRAGLEAEVANIEEQPLALHDDSELSLPGLQNKMLLVRTPAGWGRPVAGYPSTHILKVEDRRYPGLVTREAGALRLARAVGLTTVQATVETLAGIDCIIMSRYDRVPDTGQPSTTDPETLPPLARLHQEDSCQALGRDADAAAGRGKYEAAGGPTFAEIAALLDRFAADPHRELQRLLAAAVFTVAIGNADAHGKNLSLLHTGPGVVEHAPLYDTVPTALWPALRGEAAMTIGGRPGLDDVDSTDLTAEARSWRLSDRLARTVVSETASQLVSAVEGGGYPDDLTDLVLSRSRRLGTVKRR